MPPGGVEPQTLRLFEVARARGIPLLDRFEREHPEVTLDRMLTR
jgi:peptide subunit release factor RF-3